jgi:hypothetical protein
MPVTKYLAINTVKPLTPAQADMREEVEATRGNTWRARSSSSEDARTVRAASSS